MGTSGGAAKPISRGPIAMAVALIKLMGAGAGLFTATTELTNETLQVDSDRIDADCSLHKVLFHDSDNQFRKTGLVGRGAGGYPAEASPTDIETP